MTTPATSTHPPAEPSQAGRPIGGILAPVERFDLWLSAVMAVIVATCAVRYVSRHDLDAVGAAIVAGAVVLAVLHVLAGRIPLVDGGQQRRSSARVAVVAVAVLWAVLTLVAPSFAWCAVPVAFAVLRVLPNGPAIVVVVGMTVVVPVAWWRLLDAPDPTVVIGPIALAVVIVIAYRALEHQTRVRQRLVDELVAAQEDLAAADRREGALAERARLSREIHDSVGQGLSSITLMLNAAVQEWDRDPGVARTHVATAAGVTRNSLDEVRRVVRDLAPTELTTGDDEVDDGTPGHGVIAALRRVLSQAGPDLMTELRVHGPPVAIPPQIGTALTRTAQGALANVVEHSGASRMIITLTRHRDEVRLDVYDDGRGFDVAAVRAAPAGRPVSDPRLRGHGMAGIEARAQELGGVATVESTPGSGTIVSVSFPLDPGVGRGG